jgi:PAS domain S-box-containing protein
MDFGYANTSNLPTLSLYNAMLVNQGNSTHGAIKIAATASDRLLLGVAQASQALITGTTLDASIQAALQTLGQAIGVDRVYIFENHPHPETQAPAISRRWTWATDGVPTLKDQSRCQNQAYTDLSPDWYSQLSQRQPIVALTQALPASAQAILIPQGIQSLLLVPIWDRDYFWGFIGFDDCHQERQWSELEVAVLQSLAVSIGSTIAQHQLDAKLEQIIADRTAALQASESQFQFLVENASEALTTWNPDTTITYLSPHFAKMTGYVSEELVGQSFVPTVHPDDVQICAIANQAVMQTGESRSNIEFRLLHKLGGQLWVNTTITPIKNAAGEVISFQGTLRDIDHQKRLEQQLRLQILISECQAQIGTVLTQSQDLQPKLKQCTEILVKYLDAAFARIWTLSEDGTTLELKASSGLYTHIDGDHARVPVGQFKIGLIAAERQPHLTNQVLTDPRVGNKEWAAREGMVAFAGYPLMIEGQMLGVVALFARHPLDESMLDLLNSVSHSISLSIQRNHSEAQLRSQTEALQLTLTELQKTQSHLIQSEKMSSLGEMVAGVAHEINNPVNFIHGNLNHVRNYSQDLIKLTKQYRQELTQPSEALEELLEDVDLPFLLEDFPKILDDGIESTILILQNKIKSTDIRPDIQLVKQYADLPQVYCYASQLNQVFMNILANAIDALDAAYPSYIQRGIRDYRPAITIGTAITAQNTVQITIQDNGPGIPDAVKARLFDPFFTTKPVGQGTGLGLSISYQIIVDKHQGTLTCDSVPGEGTTFTITLPMLELESEPGNAI